MPDCVEDIVSSDSWKKYTLRAVYVFLMAHANTFKGIPALLLKGIIRIIIGSVKLIKQSKAIETAHL